MFIEFFLVFFSALVFIGIVKKYAPKLGLVDTPNERSIHTGQTPISAGIGFSSAVFFVLGIFHSDLLVSHTWTCLAIFLIVMIGILDDHRDTSPYTKFLIIILSSILIYCDDIVIRGLGVFFGFELSLGWLALPFTIFAVTGFTNALNLIDGLDGLAATISIIILSIFFFIGYLHHDTFMMLIAGSFISGLLAFLLFNWHPASIFMGDSGSLTLGFVISVLAIRSLDYIPTVSILFIAAIPILDTLVAMIRRKLSGLSMFCADKCHLHHVLRHFFSENTPKTVLFMGILQALYSLTGLQFAKGLDEGYLFIIFLLNTFFLHLLVGTMIKNQKRKC